MNIRYVIHTPIELREGVRSMAESAIHIRNGFESIGCDSEPIEAAFRVLAFVLESTAQQVDPEIASEIRTLTAPINGED
jgi:hypothetical protein